MSGGAILGTSKFHLMAANGFILFLFFIFRAKPMVLFVNITSSNNIGWLFLNCWGSFGAATMDHAVQLQIRPGWQSLTNWDANRDDINMPHFCKAKSFCMYNNSLLFFLFLFNLLVRYKLNPWYSSKMFFHTNQSGVWWVWCLINFLDHDSHILHKIGGLREVKVI